MEAIGTRKMRCFASDRSWLLGRIEAVVSFACRFLLWDWIGMRFRIRRHCLSWIVALPFPSRSLHCHCFAECDCSSYRECIDDPTMESSFHL